MCVRMYFYICYMCIYICVYREKLINKVIQEDKFNVRESQCYNVSVQMNHHQN